MGRRSQVSLGDVLPTSVAALRGYVVTGAAGHVVFHNATGIQRGVRKPRFLFARAFGGGGNGAGAAGADEAPVMMTARLGATGDRDAAELLVVWSRHRSETVTKAAGWGARETKTVVESGTLRTFESLLPHYVHSPSAFRRALSHIRVWAQTLTDPQLRRSDLSAFVLESRAHSLRDLCDSLTGYDISWLRAPILVGGVVMVLVWQARSRARSVPSGI